MFGRSSCRRFAGATLALALLAAPVGAMAAEEQQTFSEQAKETLAAIKDYSIEQKDAAVAEGKELLDSIGAWSEEAGSDLSEAAEEGQETTSDQLKDLRAAAGEQFEALKESSAAAWEDAKAGFASAVEKLGKALDDETDEQAKN
jgi:hypothetical protein